MIVMPLRTALLQAGVGPGDSDMEQDLRFLQWIHDRKFQIVDQGAITRVPDDLDLLLLKEKHNEPKP